MVGVRARVAHRGRPTPSGSRIGVERADLWAGTDTLKLPPRGRDVLEAVGQVCGPASHTPEARWQRRQRIVVERAPDLEG